jgi:hypothetical protein
MLVHAHGIVTSSAALSSCTQPLVNLLLVALFDAGQKLKT